MNRPELNEQQNRTLELLAEIHPIASREEKYYYLGRMDGYAAAKAEVNRAKKEEEENRLTSL